MAIVNYDDLKLGIRNMDLVKQLVQETYKDDRNIRIGIQEPDTNGVLIYKDDVPIAICKQSLYQTNNVVACKVFPQVINHIKDTKNKCTYVLFNYINGVNYDYTNKEHNKKLINSLLLLKDIPVKLNNNELASWLNSTKKNYEVIYYNAINKINKVNKIYNKAINYLLTLPKPDFNHLFYSLVHDDIGQHDGNIIVPQDQNYAMFIDVEAISYDVFGRNIIERVTNHHDLEMFNSIIKQLNKKELSCLYCYLYYDFYNVLSQHVYSVGNKNHINLKLFNKDVSFYTKLFNNLLPLLTNKNKSVL